VKTEKLKMEGKPKKRLQEISAYIKGRLFQSVAYYCGTSRTGSNTTTGQIRKIVEVLKEIHYRIAVGGNMPSGTLLPTWTTCRACSHKESKFWTKGFGYVLLT